MRLKVDGLLHFPHMLAALGLRTPLKIVRFALERSSGLAQMAKVVKARVFHHFWGDLPSGLVKTGSVFASIARKPVVWPALSFCLFLKKKTENTLLPPVSPQITCFRLRSP